MAVSDTTSNPASTLFDAINKANQSSTTTTTSKSSEQKNQFLTLLTTQLKYQDPLNPLDNAQMTSQLAQITTVDGIERLNTTLNQLMGSSSDTQALQAAALVGHGALVKGSALELTSTGAIGGFTLEKAADSVKLEIKDANGTLVRTIDMKDQEAGVHNFVWDGKDDNGTALTAGAYSFAVTAKQGADAVTTTALNFGYISGVVRNSDNSLGIDVGSYGRYTLDDLKQII